MFRKKKKVSEESYYMASQWQLMMRKFKRHKLAIFGFAMLCVLYLGAIFCEFLSPNDPLKTNMSYLDCGPTRIHIINPQTKSLSVPFIYKLEKTVDKKTLEVTYTERVSKGYPIKLFAKGDSYKLWGLFETDIHLLGVEGEDVSFYPFGTDSMGRCLMSRTLYASRVSLTVGLVGVALSFVLGCILGGISGYFGGLADIMIQKVIEFLNSLPTIPIWLALAAAVPTNWPSTMVYFCITLILSVLGWTSLARTLRGKIMAMKGEDYVTAARLMGGNSRYIITRHLIPGCMSYLIVSITLSLPSMIIGETALSYLGLGIQPPAMSWGVLLQDAQSISGIALHPWRLIPALFVVLTVISFNFLGDGLRDAADPYKQ